MKVSLTGPAGAGLLAVLLLTVLLALAGGTAVHALDQISLTEKQVQGFIAVRQEIRPIEVRSSEPPTRGSGGLLGQIERAAKKHGFANLKEYETVAKNISTIVSGIDPKTGKFSPQTGADKVTQKIDSVSSDNLISIKDKQEVLQQLKESLEALKSVKSGNIDVVTKFFEQINKAQ